ncbi:hypothetical protein [Parabacteroides timonensis]|uniref:hypothetical protein n=1 Tax=Parabacteroides timonensis TaxID=1871013 RepID=UPI00094E6909|nr:hypothetical protein [Parabacteroides timonensis]
MSYLKIVGDKNVSNTGVIQGDCIANSTIINLELYFIDLYKKLITDDKEEEKKIVDMTETQKIMAEAIGKIAQAELTKAESGKLRDEADKLRAEADKNNSIANLNYSKIILEDWGIIKQLIDKL